jgi:excisionase family DNA binding protein
MQLPLPRDDFTVPDGLPSWLAACLDAAMQENQTLADNGALHAVSARVALLNRLLEAARSHLDGELDVEEAAAALHRHPETIRRAVRSGVLPDRRSSPRGHHRIRRGDLEKLVHPGSQTYDPNADAQDIARRRRPL